MPTIAQLNEKYAKATFNPPPPDKPGIVQRANNAVNNFSSKVASFGESLLSPVTKGIATAVRAVQATPKVNDAIGNLVKGKLQDSVNSLNQANQIMAKPLNMGLEQGPQATLGGSTAVQNLGTAAQTASFLVPETGLGAIGGGAVAGGLQAGGQTALDPAVTLRQLLTNTAVGAGGGAALGAAAKYGPEILQKVLPKGDTSEASDVLASRIADATPHYNKDLVGDYVKNAEGERVPRVNEGKGLLGKRTVNTSAFEAKNGEELMNIKNYPDKGTALQKAQAVHDEITNHAENLRGSLKTEDQSRPLENTAKDQVFKNVFDKMDGDARSAVILRGKVGSLVDNGLSESDAKMLGGQPPKTIVGRYGQDVADALGEYNGTREGILDLRQKLDSVYQDARGKSAFGTEHRNALDEMHTSVRDYLNKELAESTTSIDTQASMDKQTKLFRAKDVLNNKAELEASSHYAQFVQRHPSAKMATRILSRQGIMIPLRILETAAGLGLVTKFARDLLSPPK